MNNIQRTATTIMWTITEALKEVDKIGQLCTEDRLLVTKALLRAQNNAIKHYEQEDKNDDK